MPKSVQVLQTAHNDIQYILDNLSEYMGLPLSGQKLLQDFLKSFELIGLLPKTGKLLSNGCRFTFCRHYRIVYEEFDDRIEILTVIHSRQLYPRR